MRSIHFVSHTHWDREWYLTFQQFRLKLVQLVDGLLDLLDRDPDYRHFMLDGQTIVLDDYLQIRPERRETLREHVQSGRLLIGPWHILPDEFLVSPEATVRNLLQGERTAREFGPKMKVGYVPDPFGHIGQLPQILRGFGIESAAFRRGLSDEPCEVWWQSPDGSRVFTAYLRDGYGNAALLPTVHPDYFTLGVAQARDSLAPHSAVSHLLLMHGTDHMPPPPDTSSALAHASTRLDGDRLTHSTLPAYLEAVQAELQRPASNVQLPVVCGELRSPKRHHLLPGVLSTRMWIKQRSHACETLLEKWAEPFLVFAGMVENDETTDDRRPTTESAAAGPRSSALGPSSFVHRRSSIVRHAWCLLMECHPHDSICGCSVDQVHDEMRSRFDQVEQIGEAVTRESLEAIAAQVETNGGEGSDLGGTAVVVFNALNASGTGTVEAEFEIPDRAESIAIVDSGGRGMPADVIGVGQGVAVDVWLSRNELMGMLALVQDGWLDGVDSRLAGLAIREASTRREGDTLSIDIRVARFMPPDLDALAQAWAEVAPALMDDSLVRFAVHVRGRRTARVRFVAEAVAGVGWRAFWARETKDEARTTKVADLRPSSIVVRQPTAAIENEFLRVEPAPDGTLTLTDKRTGAVYAGLNRFVDSGDCGDEYNFCPPEKDEVVECPEVVSVRTEAGAAQQTLEVVLRLDVPTGLAADRRSRSAERVALNVVTRATVVPGVPRLDITTDVENAARDHRLRVQFPASPLGPVGAADFDGHFEVVRRPIGLPGFDSSWVEQPRPEVPQRAFTDVSDGRLGLMIANRGLPEVESLKAPDGHPEIALTLLRCVGWLSRDDFPARSGHAGPALATPGAQMIGSHAFCYSVIPHAGGWQAASREAYAFNAPMRAVVTGMHSGPLPASGSFLVAEPDEFVLSAVKPAEDGTGWVVRGYNIGDGEVGVRLKPHHRISRAARANLAEEVQDALDVSADGGVRLTARGHEVVTVKFDGGWRTDIGGQWTNDERRGTMDERRETEGR